MNYVQGGWSPLEEFLGGSEDLVRQFATHFAKEHDVTVYKNGWIGDHEGVHYRSFKDFKSFEYSDVFISVKAALILANTINSDRKFHWSMDIEHWLPFQYEEVDKFIAISEWHKARCNHHEKLDYIDTWVRFDRLDKHKVQKENVALYSSSPDRGLETLLNDFDRVKEKLGFERLFVTYGFSRFDAINLGRPEGEAWKNKMLKQMQREDIVFRGAVSSQEMTELYWQAKYWILPLNNPEGELSSMDSMKAQYCECIPVVYKTGALGNVVNEYIEFDSLEGDVDTKKNKEFVKQFSFENVIKKWESLILN
jgi:glycosyltransferase involved in cell wall biosynthesis